MDAIEQAVNNAIPVSKFDDPGSIQLRQKILRVLRIYHRISPSMLQIGIGTSLPPTVWKPVLEHLIAIGEVKQEEIRDESEGRVRVFTVLLLTESGQ